MKIANDIMNRQQFITKGENGIYICCGCLERTDLSSSCSHAGYNLTCSACIRREAKLSNLSYGEAVAKIQQIGLERKIIARGLL